MKSFFQNLKPKIQDSIYTASCVLCFVFCVFPILSYSLLVIPNAVAYILPLRVFNAEGKELDPLKVWEIEATEYVSLGEVSALFGGIRKSKLLIKQETVIIRGKEIILTLGQHRLKVDGEEYVLSNPPASISGETAVPVEFLTEILPNVTGKKIILDQKNRVLQLSSEPFVRGDGTETDSHLPSDSGSGKFRVIIDPGHGGYDSGAKSKDGLLEKELTLKMARKIKELLAPQKGVEVYLTRSRDDYLTPAQRVNFANKLHGHLYLSIHFNWSPSPRFSGFRTYVNNDQMQFRGVDVLSLTGSAASKLSESEQFLRQSRQLAKEITDRLKSMKLAGEQNREASLALMNNLSMPGVLVELLYLSSPQDLRILSRPDFTDSVSQSLCDSILVFKSSLEDKSGFSGLIGI